MENTTNIANLISIIIVTLVYFLSTFILYRGTRKDFYRSIDKLHKQLNSVESKLEKANDRASNYLGDLMNVRKQWNRKTKVGEISLEDMGKIREAVMWYTLYCNDKIKDKVVSDDIEKRKNNLLSCLKGETNPSEGHPTLDGESSEIVELTEHIDFFIMLFRQLGTESSVGGKRSFNED